MTEDPFATHVVIDFHDIIDRYGPYGHSVRHLTLLGTPDDQSLMRQFLHHFPVTRFIEASLISYYETIDQESLLWEMIEYTLPDGPPFLSDDDAVLAQTNALNNCISLLFGIITSETDLLVRTVIERSAIRYPYTDYLFDAWVSPTAAVLTHRSYTPA